MADFAPGGYTSVNDDEWPYNPKFQEFAKYFGLKVIKDGKGAYWPYDGVTADRLEKLYVWAKKKAGSDDMSKIKLAVQSIADNFSSVEDREELVEHLARY